VSAIVISLTEPPGAVHADVAQLVAHHLAKVRVAGSNPVVRSKGPRDLSVEWPRGEATACKAVYTGSNPVSTSEHHRQVHHQYGRLAQGLARFPDTEEVTGSNPVSPTMAVVVRIVGVYDADGGLRGEIAYLAGKLAGRHCSLCDITHSPVRRRKEWDEYVEELPVPFEVLHRNERTQAERAATEGHEPCVVGATDEGAFVMLLDSRSLEAASDVAGLSGMLHDAMRRHDLAWPSD
jgi:hypothetical protein